MKLWILFGFRIRPKFIIRGNTGINLFYEVNPLTYFFIASVHWSVLSRRQTFLFISNETKPKTKRNHIDIELDKNNWMRWKIEEASTVKYTQIIKSSMWKVNTSILIALRLKVSCSQLFVFVYLFIVLLISSFQRWTLHWHSLLQYTHW